MRQAEHAPAVEPAVTWCYHPHQWETFRDVESRSRALVTGYGGGKTWLLARWAIHRATCNPAGSRVLLVEPTWRLCRRVVALEVAAALDSTGIKWRLNRQDLTFSFAGREILLASGEIPENLSGMTVSCAGIDEPALQKEEVDRRVSSRVRDPRASVRQVLYVGTHEGFGWFYRRTQEIPTITAPTFANTSLPAGFTDRLRDRFKGDDARYRMYVLGEAMSLDGGIYTSFAARHRKPCENPHAGSLVVGMDFNISLMVTPISRVLAGEVHVFGEVASANTTTEQHVERLIAWLTERGVASVRNGQFGREVVGHDGQRVEAWLDASAAARKTSATRTDRAIVKDAGLWPRHGSSNPPVRERIETVQYAFAHDRLFIDPIGAPLTCKALAEQSYEPGSSPPQPHKRAPGDSPEDALDAATDAVGYMVHGVSPIRVTRLRAA